MVLQNLWEAFLDTIGEDPVTLWIYFPMFLTIGVYWITGMFYTTLDLIKKPDFIKRYKTQPGTNDPVDSHKLYKVRFNTYVYLKYFLIFTYVHR